MEDVISYVAPVATTVAAFIVASNLGSRITGIGFIIFTVGSVAWAALGFVTDQHNLLWQNVILTALNLFGVWRWLGRQRQIEEGAESAANESRSSPGENLFPVSTLAKAPVFSSDGKEIGRMVEAMAGCSSGRLGYLVVSQGGMAGVGESLRKLPWTGCSVDDKRVISPLRQSQFCRLEELEPDHWPAR